MGLAGDFLDGQRDRGGDDIDQDVDAVHFQPFARLGGRDIRLVLVIGVDHLDGRSRGGGAEILNRHARGLDRALAAGVGVDAGHVGQHADADHVVGDLGGGGHGERQRGGEGERNGEAADHKRLSGGIRGR